MTQKTCRNLFRVLLAINLAWSSIIMAAPMGETVPNVQSPEGRNVLHEGRVDIQGRARIFSFLGETNGTPSFRYGAMDSTGRITWEAQPTSARFPGDMLWPDYGGRSGGIEPLPPGRSLIPVGQLTNVPRGSGAAEINSPGREFLPEYADANRPSKLAQTIEYTQDMANDLRRTAGRVVTDINSTVHLNELAKKSAQSLEKLKGPAGSVGNVSVAFYTALGFVAAYNLMLHASANPVAWSALWQQMPWNDPVGFVALLGFMAGAAWFYKKMGNAGPNGGVLRQIPFFAAALLAGSLISTSVSVFAANEHFQGCGSYYFPAAFSKKAKRDKAACDKLYDWMLDSPENEGMVSEIANGYVPLAANALAAGGIYLGVVQTVKFISNKFKIGEAIQTLLRGGGKAAPAASAPKPGIVGLGMFVIHGALFLLAFRISNAIFGVEKWVREKIITEYGLFSNRHGRSLYSAEYNLLAEWRKVALGTSKIEDFGGYLTRYNKLQNAFRATQMAETIAAYQQWMQKTNEFQEMVGASYEFYKINLPVIRLGKFTEGYLQVPLNSANKGLEELDLNGNWKYINTPTVQQFLLTSMACGPEAEGYRATGWWQATRRFMAEWWTNNTSPENMIDNSTGFKVRFYPPRITKPLPGENDTICEKKPYFTYPAIAANPLKFPITFGGTNISGLHNYIKDNVRESVGADFDKWWSERVTVGALSVQEQLRKEYIKMLNDYYRPALAKRENYWCGASPVGQTGLEKYLRQLARPDDTCGPEGLHRLNYGIMSGMRDELRLYLAMSLDLYINNPAFKERMLENDDGEGVIANTPAERESLLIPRVKRILDLFDAYAAQLAITEPEKRKDVADLYDKVRTEMNNLIGQLLPPIFQDPAAAEAAKITIPDQLKVLAALLAKAQQLRIDTGNYFNVLTALDRAPQAEENISKPN
jgi:hypothetical protein